MWVLRGRADVNVAKAAEVKAAEVGEFEAEAAEVGATVISAAIATAAEVTAAKVTAAITTVGIASEATVVAASKASGGITSKLFVVLHRDTWLFFDSFKGFVRIVVIEIREISAVVLSGMTTTRCSGALCFDLSHLGVFGANGGHSSSKSKCFKGFHLSLEFFDSV